MKYYIQYPDEGKDSLDYDKNLVADAGMSTIYLKPALRDLIVGMEMLGVEEFTEKFCDPEQIVIFSETGDEWDINSFVEMAFNKYKFVKEDY